MLALQEFMQKRIPTVVPIRWNFISWLSHTVKDYRCQLCEFFVNVTEHPDNWDSDVIMKSNGFLVFLNEFETIFMSELFLRLFRYVVQFSAKKRFWCIYCSKKVMDASNNLQYDREQILAVFLDFVISIASVNSFQQEKWGPT